MKRIFSIIALLLLCLCYSYGQKVTITITHKENLNLLDSLQRNNSLSISRRDTTIQIETDLKPFKTLILHRDHLGSVRAISDLDGNILERNDYFPFGLRTDRGENYPSLSHSSPTLSSPNLLFNGKEKQLLRSNNLDYGARSYNPITLRWTTQDPMAEKYYRYSPYTYCVNNPVKFQDLQGMEPVKSQAGTVSGFIKFFNNTSTKMGMLKGKAAHDAMIRLSKIKIEYGVKPIPATTAPFNNQENRYIYTEVGGWIDMSHFMFYAGRAYMHKMEKQDAQKLIREMENKGGLALLGISYDLYKIAYSNPFGKTIQEGYMQERGDKIFAPHSAYSYEDLPSDKFGADFGANYFDPNSKQSFGEQLKNYLNNVLRAMEPTKAPNYDMMPKTSDRQPPSRTNHTTTPIYTKHNP